MKVTKILCTETRCPARCSVKMNVVMVLCVQSGHHATCNIRTEVANILWLPDSRHHVRHSVRTDLLYGDDITFSFYVPMEVTNLLCVDSTPYARCSIRVGLLYGENNTFSFLHSNRSNKLTLCG